MPPREPSEPRGVIRTILITLVTTTLGRCALAIAAITGIDQLGLVRLPEHPRALAPVLVGTGFLLALRAAAQRALGYTRCRGRIGRRLHRLVIAECVLAGYFLGTGGLMRISPDGPAEFWFAVVGYTGLLCVGGLVVADAADAELPSVSAAVLSSPAAATLRRALRSWLSSDEMPSAPGVDASLGALTTAVPRRRSSPVMMILAFAVCAVAFANAAAASRHAANVLGLTDSLRGKASSDARPPRGAPLPVASPRAAAVPATVETSTNPTYAQLCGSAIDPGDGAPEPQASRLHDLWLGGPSGDGVGANVAGCAGPARETRSGSGIWYVTGRCGDAVQSLGVATEDGASLLLGNAARFALTKAEEGSLLSASARATIAGGDFHLVETTLGMYVVIRARVTASDATPATTTGVCAPAAAPGEPYSVVPPGLVDPWLSRAQTNWLWPKELPAAGAARRFVFREAPEGPVTATAQCGNDTSCRMIGGPWAAAAGAGAAVTPERLRSLAP